MGKQKEYSKFLTRHIDSIQGDLEDHKKQSAERQDKIQAEHVKLQLMYETITEEKRQSQRKHSTDLDEMRREHERLKMLNQKLETDLKRLQGQNKPLQRRRKRQITRDQGEQLRKKREASHSNSKQHSFPEDHQRNEDVFALDLEGIMNQHDAHSAHKVHENHPDPQTESPGSADRKTISVPSV